MLFHAVVVLGSRLSAGQVIRIIESEHSQLTASFHVSERSVSRNTNTI